MQRASSIFGYSSLLGVMPSAALFGGLPNIRDAYRSFSDTHQFARISLERAFQYYRSNAGNDPALLRAVGRLQFVANAGYWAGMGYPALALGAAGFGAYRLARRRWLSGALSLGFGLASLGGIVSIGSAMRRAEAQSNAGPRATGTNPFEED